MKLIWGCSSVKRLLLLILIHPLITLFQETITLFLPIFPVFRERVFIKILQTLIHIPCCLRQAVVLTTHPFNRLFEVVATHVNLSALRQLVDCLCTCSETRMLYSSRDGLVEEWAIVRRLGQLVSRLVRSGRPLLHLMCVWSPIKEHIIKVG